MTVADLFTFIKNEIHSTVFATVNENGLPQTCVIDIMLADEKSLYFITAKGKKFYERLIYKQYVSFSGMKGENTMSGVAVSVRGKVRDIGGELLERVFEETKYILQMKAELL